MSRLSNCITFILILISVWKKVRCEETAEKKTLTVAYLMPWNQGWPVGRRVGSAIVLGVEEVRRRQLLPGYEIEWVWRDTYCEPKRGMQVAVDVWSSVPALDAIIGGGCSVVCQPVSLLAAAWGIPVVAWACTSGSLSAKLTYPTFTRVQGTWVTLGPVFNAMADTFNWNKVAILTTPEDIMKLTADAFREELQKNNKDVTLRVVKSTVKGDAIDKVSMEELRDIMQELQQEFRIYYIISYPTDVRNMLLTAYDLGMMNGDCAFGTFEFAIDLTVQHTYRPEMVNDLLYQGVLVVGVKRFSGPEYEQFLHGVLESFQDPRFADLPHLAIDADINSIDQYAGSVHDAVLQWAYGVNKTLAQGLPANDGYAVTRNIFNLTFEGMTGTVSIDEIGDRNPDQRIDIIQNNARIPLMEWIAAKGRLIALYKAPGGAGNWSGIVWPGNSSTVPSDSPLCGWGGVLCEDDLQDSYIIELILPLSCGILVFVICVLGCVGMRKYKYETALKDINKMKINWSNINIDKVTTEPGEKDEVDQIQLENYAVYQANPVFIESLELRNIDTSKRSIQVDLKNMRDLRHDNVLPFIGVCCEAPHSCIVMGYARRGSLRDIIARGEAELDWDFKTFLALDIARGMQYLHRSDIGEHGRLTSSKCVVDSKWTCKITGHGMPHLRTRKTSAMEPTLWTAPEHCRAATTGKISSSKKGDVYSYGIIVQELILEGEPYCANEPWLESSVIIDLIAKGRSGTPHRPSIPGDSCPEAWENLMQDCWGEDPNQRPTFSQIIQAIKRTKKGKRFNLVDNMVARLETHACDLENRVAERTGDLESEKSKMEMLLSELLPGPTIVKLMSGQTITPESFTSVTLFFSDIVGFTKVAAAAGPLDIVVLLNNMYTLFDDVARGFDVYKVATIGDAYMVASGVPIRNGDKHATEICKMSLHLVDVIEDFPIPHLPTQRLQLRIGIHSGPCVAGVTGTKMPRYLLFGDTVTVAEQMESAGVPMRIHVSQTTQNLIGNSGTVNLTERGKVVLKNGMEMKTYWLSSKSQF